MAFHHAASKSGSLVRPSAERTSSAQSLFADSIPSCLGAHRRHFANAVFCVGVVGVLSTEARNDNCCPGFGAPPNVADRSNYTSRPCPPPVKTARKPLSGNVTGMCGRILTRSRKRPPCSSRQVAFVTHDVLS